MSAKTIIESGKAILGIEFVNIDKNTTISSFKQQLRNNEIYYMLNKALR